MNLEDALSAIGLGKRVSRPAWGRDYLEFRGSEQCNSVKIVTPDGTEFGDCLSWDPIEDDLEADDYYTLDAVITEVNNGP